MSQTITRMKEFQVVLENFEGEQIDVFIEAYEVKLLNSYEILVNGSCQSFGHSIISIF